MRYWIFAILSFLIISCEEETPTSEFVPSSFFENTLDKIVAEVDGREFFFEINPTAALDNSSGSNSLIIRFTSTDLGDIALTIPVFIGEDNIYNVNASTAEDIFRGDYVDTQGNRYTAVANSTGSTDDNSGTINLTVDRTARKLNGTFDFTAQLETSSGGSNLREVVFVTDGVIRDISY